MQTSSLAMETAIDRVATLQSQYFALGAMTTAIA